MGGEQFREIFASCSNCPLLTAHCPLRKMAKQDYYEVLGVKRDAKPEEIKRLIAGWRANIIRTSIQVTKLPRSVSS